MSTAMRETELLVERDALDEGERGSALARGLGYVCVPIRVALAGVFFYAAWQKLKPTAGATTGPQLFSESVKALSSKAGIPLADHIVQVTTAVVPWVEVVAALLLLIGLWTRAAALVILIMLLGFTGMYISVILSGETNLKCGCFGDRALFCTGGVGWCHVYQNLAMAGMALLAVLTVRHQLAVDAARRASL